jgi:hypothetical protein
MQFIERQKRVETNSKAEYKIGCAGEEELLFCAWENFPRAALCRAVADSQLISVGEREREARVVGKLSRFSLVSTLIGAKSRPFISSFSCQVFLSIRFDFAPIRFNFVQSTCHILYTRASQSENANYFRALFFCRSLRWREIFCAPRVYNIIHTQWWDDTQAAASARNN